MEMATAIDFLNTEVVPFTSMTNQLVKTWDSRETLQYVNMNLWFTINTIYSTTSTVKSGNIQESAGGKERYSE